MTLFDLNQKIMRKLFSLFILLTTVTGAVQAQENTNGTSRDFREDARYQKMLDRIPNLSEDQKDQLDVMIQGFLENTQPLRAEIKELEDKISDISSSKKSDLKEGVEEFEEKMNELSGKVKEERKALEEQIRGIMNAEQLESIEAQRKSK